MIRFLKHNKIDIVWGICTVLSLGVISIILYKEINNEVENLKQLISLLITSIVIITVILFWFLRFRRKVFCRLRTKTKLLDVLFVSIFILFFLVLAYHHNILHDLFQNNIGGFFAISIGLATILGTYWAIRSIIEMKHTITDYPQLMDRLTELLNDTSSKEIRIVSYFILPGYWQVRIKRYRERFEQALLNAKDKIKIACLTHDENLNIVIDVAKKGVPLYRNSGVSAENIIDFQKKCENILSNFEKYPPKRLEWDDLPHYFFFVTDDKAIIVTPVGLSQKNKNINQDSIKNIAEKIKNNINVGLENSINAILNGIPDHNHSGSVEAKVDTFGFETSDQRIIDKLWALFDEYYNKKGVKTDVISNNSIPTLSNNQVFLNSQKNAQNIGGNVNVEVNNSSDTTNVLVEVSNKIKVTVNVQV